MWTYGEFWRGNAGSRFLTRGGRDGQQSTAIVLPDNSAASGERMKL